MGHQSFLDRKFIAASILMSVATYIQLLEGLDVMIVLCLIMFLMVIIKQIPLKTFLLFGVVYACTAGVYLAVILMNKMGNIPGVAPGITNADVFNIIFQFRHPHHFIFTSFPKFKMLVFFVLTLCSLIFYSGVHPKYSTLF